MRKIQEDSIV